MFVYLQLSAFACTAVPSHQVDAQPCSVGICIQEDVASTSTAEAFGGMPILSHIMQVEGLLCRVSDPDNLSRPVEVGYNSVFCADRTHEL